MSFQKYLKENENMAALIRKAEEAKNALVHAEILLDELQDDWEKATGQRTTDFLSFSNMVAEIISSDNGEAGLEPFINSLKQS